MTDETPHDLLLQIKSGNQDATEALYDLVSKPLTKHLTYRFCPPLTKEDVEDILQHTFLQILMNASAYEGANKSGSAKGWIYAIAENRAKKLAGLANSAPVSLEDLGEKDDLEDHENILERRSPPSEEESPEEQALQTILIEQLKLFINDLEERDRSILTLRFKEELTLEVVGKNHGLSKPRVKQIQDRILARARRFMGRSR